MSMSVGSSSAKDADPEPMMEMNMTPLIDVLLVLIIMLIITIPKQNLGQSEHADGYPATADGCQAGRGHHRRGL